ncbi:hypothetical protein ACE1TH_12490 [Shouchella sp. JSM 1781072]|uniref:hypothetical protein n=1 Tax=Shouchella sp. JSM 1781072 TaxID=3344581 RepID=UPI0035C11337
MIVMEYPRPLFYASTGSRKVKEAGRVIAKKYRWFPETQDAATSRPRVATSNVYLTIEDARGQYTIRQTKESFRNGQHWAIEKNGECIGEVFMPRTVIPSHHRLEVRLTNQDVEKNVDIRFHNRSKADIYFNGGWLGETFTSGMFFNRKIVINMLDDRMIDRILLTVLVHTYWCASNVG